MRQMAAKSLVLAPFHGTSSRVVATVRRALEEMGITTFGLDNIAPGASWVNAITDAIKASDFIVVDITSPNPNVLYELGYAHAFRKPTLAIRSTKAKSPPPSDLTGMMYVVYDPNDLSSLKGQIQRAAQHYVGGKS